MTRRRVTLAVLLFCMGLDFASPMVPGSFCFDVDSSVDGIRAQRSRAPVLGLDALPVPAPRPVGSASAW